MKRGKQPVSGAVSAYETSEREREYPFASDVGKIDIFQHEGFVFVGDFKDAVHGVLRMFRVVAAARN